MPALMGPAGPTLWAGRRMRTKKPDEAENGFEDPCSREHRFGKLRRNMGQIHSTGKQRKRHLEDPFHTQTAVYTKYSFK